MVIGIGWVCGDNILFAVLAVDASELRVVDCEQELQRLTTRVELLEVLTEWRREGRRGRRRQLRRGEERLR